MPAPPIAEPHAVAAFLAGITAAGYLLARRFRWARVVSPSLLVLGYAVGTYLGLGVAALLRAAG